MLSEQALLAPQGLSSEEPTSASRLHLNHTRAAASSTPSRSGTAADTGPRPGRGGVLSLTLTVLITVRRRRRELALLKVVGMSRRQVRAIITWQTTLTLGIAIGAGAPLGIAAGRWAWGTFAGSLGSARLP
jgi:hypothetical protein